MANKGENNTNKAEIRINFNRLPIGALRKYQYAFKISMSKDEKPLLTRIELVRAIENHFNNVLHVSEGSVIQKFLKLKKEEAC